MVCYPHSYRDFVHVYTTWLIAGRARPLGHLRTMLYNKFIVIIMIMYRKSKLDSIRASFLLQVQCWQQRPSVRTSDYFGLTLNPNLQEALKGLHTQTCVVEK
uniref:Uncharacterized protein n=1 Tax=Cacopsylla melanoneura TaxID=428564 RepID=A0A8D8YQ73_9HEMI